MAHCYILDRGVQFITMTGLSGVGANPIPNCKLGFGSCVRSDCVQTLSSFINYVGENG